MDEARTIKNLDFTFGYSYFDIQSNEERIEIHVDYRNRIISQQLNHQDPNAGPNNRREKKATTSVRVSASRRPISIVGQDESVFAMYLLGGRTWVGPKVQRLLLPKSQGDGFMLSAFISREFGFG